MPHSSPSGLYPEAPVPGLTLTLPAATRELNSAPDSAPTGWGRLMGNTTSLGCRNCALPDSAGSRCWGQAPQSPAHHCCDHSGTFGTWHSPHPSASAHTAKQGTQTPTNITSKPPGSHKAKAVSKVTLDFPSPPYPSFREHLGRTDLPQPPDHISTWEGPSYFQAR